MAENIEKIELPHNPKEPKPPHRPSYERVAANIEKWASSSGLQKPK